MFNQIEEKISDLLDQFGSGVWALFEKDVAMLESLFQRTENFILAVEARAPESLRKLYRNDR